MQKVTLLSDEFYNVNDNSVNATSAFFVIQARIVRRNTATHTSILKKPTLFNYKLYFSLSPPPFHDDDDDDDDDDNG